NASDPWALGAVGVFVPGCRTRRLASRVLELLEQPRKTEASAAQDKSEEFGSEREDRIASFLLSADSRRTLAFLRRTAAPDAPARNGARRMLLRTGDRESAAMLFDWIRKESPKGIDDAWIEAIDGPEALAWLREKAAGKDGEDAFPALARRAGWPRRVPF